MWEKTREDGTRRLKHNGVPTIFSFSQTEKQRKPPRQRSLVLCKKIKVGMCDLVVLVSTYVLIEFLFLDELDEQVVHSSDDIGRGVELSSQVLSQPSTSTEVVSVATSSSSYSSSFSVEDLPPLNQNTEKNTVSEKLARYEKLYLRERAKANKFKNKLRIMRKRMKSIKAIEQQTSEQKRQFPLLLGIFNSDQVRALKRKQNKKSTKLMKWSNDTITRSLRLKFSCGNNGYTELLNQGYPLPSIRTLQRRMQNLKFDHGILEEVFEFLKIKINSMDSHEKDCVLVLDEMAITPGKTYDTSLNKYLGEVTLPGHTGIATHVLVFMLGGITKRWKQIVAYYFTGDSVNGAVFKEIIECIFQKAEDLQLNIVSVTSDMGSCNQALWKTWGISAGRYCPINCKIPHPLNANTFLHVFADVPHLFKNIKSMLITNKIIQLPNSIVEKHALPTKEILSSHIFELAKYQESHIFKLAPKLSEEDLLPSHFSKMKVSTSSNVISHSVSSALKFLADELKKPEYLTTAWFLDQIEKWFFLMTSRHPSCALSKLNIDVYNSTIGFLKQILELFSSMEVGHKKIWKPSQTGVLISTQSMLDLQEYLLNEKKYTFFLTSRVSQDCLENLFCVLRSKQLVPNAVQVKNNLKLISVSQYLKNVSSSSYDVDDREFFSGFLDNIQAREQRYDDVQLPSEIQTPSFNLNYSELNSLYNICGYILQSIKKTSKTCNNCIKAAGGKTPMFKTFSRFSMLKRYRENCLFFCNEEIFCFFLDMEHIFRKYISIVSSQNINLKDFFFKKMCDDNLVLNVPDCHLLKTKIMKRYIVFRLKISSKKHKSASKKLASKSVAGYLL